MPKAETSEARLGVDIAIAVGLTGGLADVACFESIMARLLVDGEHCSDAAEEEKITFRLRSPRNAEKVRHRDLRRSGRCVHKATEHNYGHC
jgi:hypothetical protein